MSRRKFGDIESLINDLLDRHEANPRAERLLAYIDEDAFRSVEERDRFTQALLSAEAAGGIVIQRVRIDGQLTLGHVRLADPDALYGYLERIPAGKRVDAELSVARARNDLPATAQAILEEIAEAWSRGVARFGLAAHDGVGLAASLDLTNALAARANDAGAMPVDYRTFSRSAGTDSKALERLVNSISKLFERLYPDRGVIKLSPEDWLATLGVLRTPQPLTLSGPIAVDGVPLPPLRFHGVPPEQGEMLALAGPVDYVLTIENYTSFVRHVREINADHSGLVVYTGGFPSRAHLQQILRLAEAAQAPLFHWGDIDGGGLRIFRHLESALAQRGLRLQPHLMDSALLQEHGVMRENVDRRGKGTPVAG